MKKLELNKLFEPGQIGQMKLKNRLVCPAMVRNFGTEEGFVTKRSLDHYETLAKGGVGLIIVEATCIDAPRGKGYDYGLVLDNDRFIPGFKELADGIHRYDAKVAVQLHHVGAIANVCTTHMQPIGPSAACFPGFEPSRDLTTREIRDIVIKFGKAAERAMKAGVDAIEIHGAHMYLISQFLSPATNKRQDSYGGNIENRARFLLEVFESVRKSVGKDFPVWCRINGEEFGIENGLTIEESKFVAKLLEKAGADAIHVSAWGAGKYAGYGGGVMYDPPGNLIHLAEAVRRVIDIPVIAVGKLNLELAEEILQKGKADFVAIGRSLLADPDLPSKAAEGRLEDIRPCIWCRFCGDIFLHVKRSGIRCQVNAALGREGEYHVKTSEFRKRILVIGGGPAGMEAARIAALRGHEVMLYERESRLGGQMNLAAMAPYKTPIRDFIDYLSNQIKKLNVKIELGIEVTPTLIDNLKPDVIILATGRIPIVPKIPGIDRPHVVKAEDVLSGKIEVRQRVVIIGGGIVGCETADYLSEKGKQVIIIEMLPEMAMGMGLRMRSRLLDRLMEKGVNMLTSSKCQEIRAYDLIFLNSDGNRQNVEADTVLIAAGSQPNRELCQKIGTLVPETYLVGDCVEPGHIMEAIKDGSNTACMI